MLLIGNTNYSNASINDTLGHKSNRITFVFQKALRRGSTIRLRMVQWAYGTPAAYFTTIPVKYTGFEFLPYTLQIDKCYAVKLGFVSYKTDSVMCSNSTNLTNDNSTPYGSTLIFPTTTVFLSGTNDQNAVLGGGVHNMDVTFAHLEEDTFKFEIDVEFLGYNTTLGAVSPPDSQGNIRGSVMDSLTVMLEVFDSHQVGSS